jgi:hypothetical protein
MRTDQEVRAAVDAWDGLKKFWKELVKERLAETRSLRGAILTDQEIVSKTSALAWAFAASEDVVHPHGARIDMMHLPHSQQKWKQASAAFEKLSGINSQEALRRHEAWLRNKDNAPELHVDRR